MSPGNIGRNLRRLREEKGLTQDGLSAAMGVSKAWISQVETGASTPNVERLLEFARLLDADVSAFLRDA